MTIMSSPSARSANAMDRRLTADAPGVSTTWSSRDSWQTEEHGSRPAQADSEGSGPTCRRLDREALPLHPQVDSQGLGGRTDRLLSEAVCRQPRRPKVSGLRGVLWPKLRMQSARDSTRPCRSDERFADYEFIWVSLTPLSAALQMAASPWPTWSSPRPRSG